MRTRIVMRSLVRLPACGIGRMASSRVKRDNLNDGSNAGAFERDSGALQAKADGSVRLQLHVKPGARQSRVTGLTESSVEIQIAAPPRDGEANAEVVRYVAEALGVRPRQVELVSGHKSRDKAVVVRLDQGDERGVSGLRARLEGEISEHKR